MTHHAFCFPWPRRGHDLAGDAELHHHVAIELGETRRPDGRNQLNRPASAASDGAYGVGGSPRRDKQPAGGRHALGHRHQGQPPAWLEHPPELRQHARDVDLGAEVQHVGAEEAIKGCIRERQLARVRLADRCAGALPDELEHDTPNVDGDGHSTRREGSLQAGMIEPGAGADVEQSLPRRKFQAVERAAFAPRS